jgi:hypothetical protein
MKLPTIAIPVIRNNRFKEGGKVTASLTYNWETDRKCRAACSEQGNFGTSVDSCVNECYWETGWWTGKCSGARFC